SRYEALTTGDVIHTDRLIHNNRTCGREIRQCIASIYYYRRAFLGFNSPSIIKLIFLSQEVRAAFIYPYQCRDLSEGIIVPLSFKLLESDVTILEAGQP